MDRIPILTKMSDKISSNAMYVKSKEVILKDE